MKTRLLLLIFFFSSLAHAQIPTDGLVGCYLFSGGTNDTSGNANDLTNFGATPTADRFGKDSSAYRFDGWSSYMLCNLPALPTADSPRTVTAFFRTPSPQVVDQYIVGWGTQANDQDWYLDINNGNLRLVIWNDDMILTQIKADTWYHFAAVYNDSTLTLYVNGRSVAASVRHLNTVSLGYLSVGATMVNDSVFTGYFKGDIDDICLYDRALAASEIKTLYRAVPGDSQFDGGAPPPLYDTAETAATYDSLSNPNTYTQSNTASTTVQEAPAPPQIADAQYDQPDPQGFQAALSPYGEWVNSSLGYGWRPLGVGMGWRPYLRGRWEWTDYGWYWVSSEPFGWATYHYGRWYVDDFYGWVWIPGATWGPAWVEWRSNDNYIGWAPLTPASVYTSGGIMVENRSWYSPPSYWNFVAYGNFGSANIEDHAEPVGHYQRIMPTTHRNVDIVNRGGRIVNSGIDVRVVSRHMGSRMPRAAVVEGNQTGGEKVTRGSGSQRIQVYRPRITRLAARPKPNRSDVGPGGQDQSGSAPAPSDQQGGGSRDNGSGRDVNNSGNGNNQSVPASSSFPPLPTGVGSSTPNWPTMSPGTRIVRSPAAPAPANPAPNPNQGGGSGRHVDTPPTVQPPQPVVTPPPTRTPRDGGRKAIPEPTAPEPAPAKVHLHRHLHSKQVAPVAPSAPRVNQSGPAPAQVSPPAPKKKDEPKVIKPDPAAHH